jgi:hypothetical protein
MSTISVVERVRLNYSACTIASIIIYTFSVSAFFEYFTRLWPHVLYFLVSEMMKLLVLQRFYSLDTSYTQDGVRKRRGNKFSESIKFAVLMILTVFSFAFICIVLGGKKMKNFLSISNNN